MAIRYEYVLQVKYVIPRTNETHTELVGPVFRQKTVDRLTEQLMRKRNVIGITTIKRLAEYGGQKEEY